MGVVECLATVKLKKTHRSMACVEESQEKTFSHKKYNKTT